MLFNPTVGFHVYEFAPLAIKRAVCCPKQIEVLFTDIGTGVFIKTVVVPVLKQPPELVPVTV